MVSPLKLNPKKVTSIEQGSRTSLELFFRENFTTLGEWNEAKFHFWAIKRYCHLGPSLTTTQILFYDVLQASIISFLTFRPWEKDVPTSGSDLNNYNHMQKTRYFWILRAKYFFCSFLMLAHNCVKSFTRVVAILKHLKCISTLANHSINTKLHFCICTRLHIVILYSKYLKYDKYVKSTIVKRVLSVV